MTLKHLKIFWQVYNDGSVTKAAQTLGITQPSASVAISELESFYEVQLFNRIYRKLSPTPAGEKLYEYANKIILQFNESVNTIKGSDVRKILKIGLSSNFSSCYASDIIKEFQTQCPNVEIKIYAYAAETVLEMVEKLEVDFGVIDFTPPENMKSVFLATQEFVLLCSDNFDYNLPNPAKASDLKNIPLILPSTPLSHFTPLRSYLDREGIKDNFLLYTSGAHVMIETASAGLAALPILKNLAEERIIRYTNCRIVEIQDPPTVEFSVIYPKGKFLDSVMQKCIDIICKFAKKP